VTAAAVAADAASLGQGRATLGTSVRSEWIKIRSLRSTWWALAAMVALIVGLGTLFAAFRAHRYDQLGAGGFGLIDDPTEISLRGIFLGQLAVGVLGVLVISGEYATGMIRASLTALPRRWPVLAGKALVLAAVALVVTEAASFAGFLAGQAALASTHHQASLSSPGALRACLGAGVYLTIIALLGVGLGFALRSTAGGIATLVGIVLVLPLLAEALPAPYSTDVIRYLPLTAGTQIIATRLDPNALAPWAGIGVAAGYAAAALLVGLYLLRRRDA
jgi:ABC-type transport system involved in multi-copper enzyme maturation permease subunit